MVVEASLMAVDDRILAEEIFSDKLIRLEPERLHRSPSRCGFIGFYHVDSDCWIGLVEHLFTNDLNIDPEVR